MENLVSENCNHEWQETDDYCWVCVKCGAKITYINCQVCNEERLAHVIGEEVICDKCNRIGYFSDTQRLPRKTPSRSPLNSSTGGL